MKISIDNMLGSAKRIKGQMQADDQSRNGRNREVRSDSLTIENKVNSRINTIQTEIRELQFSLTRNQIVRDGITLLQDDMSRGGSGREEILNDVQFEGRQVLREFVGSNVNSEVLATAKNRTQELINGDVSSLRKLQVESENILASRLGGSDSAERLVGNIETAMAKFDRTPESLTNLNPDTVRRLIR
ncbi:MAG TPA: hypothetical protein PK200_16710 [Spirochaetota bacterium]|nr:hypothetical protein [Spirochaetota bacterium]HQP49212.1 hypothetical protein [Spirochaetota bacterium]